MIKLLTPDAMVERVEDISRDLLTGWGARGIALDLDNTIVPWHTADVRPAIAAWVATLVRSGLRVCLLTNNYAQHARDVAAALNVPIVAGALKPAPFAFRRALEAMGTEAARSVVVGDQLFTDVLGGKLVGMRAVLVQPIGAREFPTTKILRWLERPLISRLRKAGAASH
ncbi:MAG TPA: YqeG family HAD IIIA-type phosphatase [Candidatus Tumulicola sp.]|nr:YqeG family HAD IIIA-type phosphatase [Candidatus Tumulicola sp.]